MAELVIAAPGELGAPTGGYRYDARVLEEIAGRGHQATWLPLPTDFPLASDAAVEEALARLKSVPPSATLVIDGLGYGALPAAGIEALGRPVAALVHHPLALETGLDAAAAARLDATERLALTKAAVVIVTSDATRTTLAEDYGVPATKIRVAEPGVDPAPKARGSGGDAPVVLTVGAVTPRKNQVALACAFGRLKDLSWRWRIVGSLTRDASYAGELDAAITAAGVRDRVDTLGEVPEEALAAAFDGADLFALASKLEGYGMACAEALGRGLPVVVGESAATAALVPENAGALVPQDDDAAIAAALRALIGDADALARAARAARSAGVRLPRWFQCADVFEHLMLSGVAAARA